ncbi:MAG: hypothetical protein IJE97_00085, partial [Thermoguttaceae bacterium]|nr:hypothetical protein [Thermoguttaceae bacterium]
QKVVAQTSLALAETIGTRDGRRAWIATGVNDESNERKESATASWTSLPQGATGAVDTEYEKNVEENYATLQTLADETWSYVDGTSTLAFDESTSVDKTLSIQSPSNSANGRHVNWTIKTGEKSTDS